MKLKHHLNKCTTQCNTAKLVSRINWFSWSRRSRAQTLHSFAWCMNFSFSRWRRATRAGCETCMTEQAAWISAAVTAHRWGWMSGRLEANSDFTVKTIRELQLSGWTVDPTWLHFRTTRAQSLPVALTHPESGSDVSSDSAPPVNAAQKLSWKLTLYKVFPVIMIMQVFFLAQIKKRAVLFSRT